jgi:hypothetical protein
MSNLVTTYDPKQFSLIVGGKIITGFADGEYITVERNEQAYNLKVGVDGEGTRAKSNNKSGKVTIVLMQSSRSNDDLSAYAQLDESSNKGVVPVLGRDGSGRTAFGAATAWIQKFAPAPFAKEVGTRTWVLETNELDVFIGGN